MNVTLSGILKVVGRLDDRSGEDTARDRFRVFLEENVKDAGQLRDYLDECLTISDPQHNRALQDLINFIGTLLGFDVKYGRYAGATGYIGFDGYWKSSTQSDGFFIVIEAKTTETYPIKTTTLVGYVDELISENVIPSWDNALGLYVIGRPDPEIKQLENAIIAQKRSHQLRIISVDSLLSLAEMISDYDVSHDDILAYIRPSGPTIDPIVDLTSRLLAEATAANVAKPEPQPPQVQADFKEPPPRSDVSYWLTPVRSDDEETAEQCILNLVGQQRIYAFGERTPGRKVIKPGDWICFYAQGKGVVAYAQVASLPEHKLHPKVRHAEKYPWVFELKNVTLFLEDPVVIDATLRSVLDKFKILDTKNWGLFVKSTNKITEHDFQILTRNKPMTES